MNSHSCALYVTTITSTPCAYSVQVIVLLYTHVLYCRYVGLQVRLLMYRTGHSIVQYEPRPFSLSRLSKGYIFDLQDSTVLYFHTGPWEGITRPLSIRSAMFTLSFQVHSSHSRSSSSSSCDQDLIIILLVRVIRLLL